MYADAVARSLVTLSGNQRKMIVLSLLSFLALC
jgi:hypothetical protein